MLVQIAALILASSPLPTAPFPVPVQGPPPSPVRVDAVGLEELQDRRLVTGKVRAARRAVVATREAGLVSEVLAREGSRVAAGEVLVRLDGSLLEAELRINAAERVEAEARLTEREAQDKQARADQAALEQLAERGAANPKEVADARSVAAATAARLSQARAGLETNAARRQLLERRLADMSPRAPFAGTVVARRVEQGEWVQGGGALFELVGTESLEAWLDVPQEFYAAVASTSGPFDLSLDSGGTVRALSRRIVPDVAEGARSFALIAPLDGGVEAGEGTGEGTGTALAPGMTLTAHLPTGERREALTVHRDGILRNEVGPYVYVAMPGPPEAGGGHQAVPMPVELLFFSGDRAAVRSPALQPGALVVVEGNERLYPTAPLAVVPE